jgi:N-acetylglutamate synthase-like GNAT family acetyltransferase
LFEDSKLIGVSNGRTTNRFYCVKQLEIDNLVINEEKRSKGYGYLFLKNLENCCKNGIMNPLN